MMRSELLVPNPRVAIIMLSAIGDAVHVLPVANALKRKIQGLSLTWVIQPVPYKLVRNHPAIDEFIIFERLRGISAFKEFARLRRELRTREFDLVIDLQVYFKAGLLTWFARAPVKLGFDRRRARDLNWLFTSDRIPPRPDQHVQDQYFEFLAHLGIEPEPVEWGIVFSEEEQTEQRRFFERVSKPVCSVVVGSSKAKKDWAPERYARLLEIVESDFGFRTVIVGGPSAGERASAAEIERLSRARPLNQLGDDLRRLMYLVDGSDLLVSPDTGPLHIARALDTPVVGLYGYTNPKRSGPYRKYQDLVVDGYARHPGEEYPASMEYRRDGMGRITLDMVREKIDLAVSRYGVGQGNRRR
ncbi:MAG: glycosyltransferase family 9 protein [Gemmatimonadota bacterium]|nr:MAG: glycosyltransferase family 9 protein [Gemmatimonadota bacterium]